MSQLIFQGAFNLLSVLPSENGRWEVKIRFRDNEGIFTASDIKVGDVLLLDTGLLEPGTITRYETIDVIDADWMGQATLIISYLENNINQFPNPEIVWIAGSEGVIARPSPKQSLLPVSSPDVQRITDRFTYFIHNYNTQVILDQYEGGDGLSVLPNIGIITVKLQMEEGGIAYLNNKPMGDVLFNIAILHLNVPCVVEVTGVKIIQIGERWAVEIESDDYETFSSSVTHLTVSYLGLLDTAYQHISEKITEIDLDGFEGDVVYYY